MSQKKAQNQKYKNNPHAKTPATGQADVRTDRSDRSNKYNNWVNLQNIKENNAQWTLASNLAISYIHSVLGLGQGKSKAFYELLNGKDNNQNTSTIYPILNNIIKNEINNTPDESIIKNLEDRFENFPDIFKNLDTLYRRIYQNIPDSRKNYNTLWESRMLMLDACQIIYYLRNFCSHTTISDIRKSEETIKNLMERKIRFIKWLEYLIAQASTLHGIEVKTCPIDVNQTKNKETNTFTIAYFWKLFLFNLFLTKGQSKSFLQGQFNIDKSSKNNRKFYKRHEIAALTAFSRRGHVTDIQNDPVASLAREIIGALCLPPIESYEGQQRLEQAIKEKKQDGETLTYNFRTANKWRQYALNAIDLLNLMPEMKFWGFEQTRQQYNDPDNTIDSTQDNASLTENIMYSPWETRHKKIKEKNKSLPNTSNKEKFAIDRFYSRNNTIYQGDKKQTRRFIYESSDDNFRFELTINCQNDGQDKPQTVRGVMRSRDAINLFYFVLTKPETWGKIRDWIFQWLTNYHIALEKALTIASNKGDKEKFKNDHADYLKYLPTQMYKNIVEDQENKNLLQNRIEKSLKAKLCYTLRLIDQYNKDPYILKSKNKQNSNKQVYQKEDNSISNELQSLKEYNSTHLHARLTKNEMVQEILHEIIRNFNHNQRKKFSKHYFIHAQKLLLNYTGQGFSKELQNYNSSSHSNKAGFWLWLRKTFSNFNENKKDYNPLDCPKIYEGKNFKDHSNPVLVNIKTLYFNVIRERRKNLEQTLQILAKGECLQDDLEQLAARWQINLQYRNHNILNNDSEEITNKVQQGNRIGIDASKYYAQLYSVLPHSFVQEALGLTLTQSSNPTENHQKITDAEKGMKYCNLSEHIKNDNSHRLQLLSEYYNVHLLYQETNPEYFKENKPIKLSELHDAKLKKQWKDSSKILSAWHLQDMLCMIIADKLLYKANINFKATNGKIRVADLSKQDLFFIPFENLFDAKGQQRETAITLRLNDMHQMTRQWNNWNLEKLKKALGYYVQGETADVKKIVELMHNQERADLETIKTILEWESNFYQNLPEEKKKELHNGENYINFSQLLNTYCNVHSSLPSNQARGIKTVRNCAFHSGLPTPSQMKALGHSSNIIAPAELGKNVLECLKNPQETTQQGSKK